MKIKRVRFAVLIALISVFAFAIVGCGNTTSNEPGKNESNKNEADKDETDKGEKVVDISKYVSIEWEIPYEGYGKPVLKIDEEGLNKFMNPTLVAAFLKEYIKDGSMSGYFKDMTYEEACGKIDEWISDPTSEMYPGFTNFFNIYFAVQPMQQVSNGDVMKVMVRMDSEFKKYMNKDAEALAAKLGFKIKEYDLEFVADGLTEPQKVLDLVKPMEKFLVYGGVNGEGTVKMDARIGYKEEIQVHDLTIKIRWSYYIDLYHGEEKLASLKYAFTKNEKLTGGDVIGITVQNLPVEKLEAMGYVIPFETKAVTMPDFGSYLMSKDQITSDTVAHIKTYMENYINDGFNTCENVSNIYFIKQIIGDDGREYSPYVVVITENSYVNYGDKRTYKAWVLEDVVIRANEVSVRYINTSRFDSTSDLEDAREMVRKRYSSDQLDFVTIQ